MVETETRNHIEGYFGNEFPMIRNYCRVMVQDINKFQEIFRIFLKNDYLQ